MALSPKVLAYIRAAEVVEKACAERGLYDRATATAINRELKAIAKRLNDSIHKIMGNEFIKEKCENDPEFSAVWKRENKYSRYLNSIRTERRLRDQIKKEQEKQDGKQ